MPALQPDEQMPERTLPRVRAHERAFGVLEIVIACALMAILLAMVIPQFFGAKQTARAKDALAAAAAYDQAVASFKADHANRLPAGADWVSVGGKPAGPKNLLNRAYLGSPPEAVASGRAQFHPTCAGGAPSGAVAAVISFCPETAPNYGIRVAYQDGGAVKTCWYGSTARSPRCGQAQ